MIGKNENTDRWCDGSSVQAIREDLALSQEDGSPTAADQVGNFTSYNS